MEDRTTETGAINSLTVYYRARWEGYESSNDARAEIAWGSVVNTYYGDWELLTNDYVTYSHTWTQDPHTTSDFSWASIDGWQAGCEIDTDCRGTQCYAVVNYDISVQPEIQTSQCYAVVNYTPAANTVTLNDPQELSVSHSRKLGRFTFSDGDYEVADFGRSTKTLTMSGFEYASADDDMQDVKDMTHYPAVVAVTNLDDTNLNTNYWIRDFNFTRMGGEPTIYHWVLVLEEA